MYIESEIDIMSEILWNVPESYYPYIAGKISLDHVFQERERLNHNIVGEI